MARLLCAVARVVIRFPVPVLLVALLSAAGALWYTAGHLRFEMARSALVGSGERYDRLYQEYRQDFPDYERLVVVVEAGQVAEAKAYAAALADRLRADPAHVRDVFYRIDPQEFEDRALLYLGLGELRTLRAKVEEHREFLAAFAARPTLEQFFALTNREVTRGLVRHLFTDLEPEGSEGQPLSVDLPLFTRVLEGMRDSVAGRAAYRSPWAAFVPRADGESGTDGYLLSADERFLFLLVAPVEAETTFLDLWGPGGAADPVEAVRAAAAAVRQDFPGVSVGVTGSPALAADEMRATQRDILLASVLGFLANALLLIIPFRAVIKPAFALLSLLVGLAWAFGFATLTVGHLNLLSAVFSSILIGIGINFPIHLLARYEEARRTGKDVPAALEESLGRTGVGVLGAVVIMAAAFWAALLTDFRGIAELGFIAGSGLFLCFLASITVFPACIALEDARRSAPPLPPARPAIAPAGNRWDLLLGRPRLVVSVGVLLALVPLAFVPRIGFDYNLLRLLPRGSEAVATEERLQARAGHSTWFAVSLAPTLEEAERRRAAFAALPEVRRVEGVLDLLPAQQEEKRQILRALRPAVAGLQVRRVSRETSDLVPLTESLRRIHFKLGEEGGEAEVAAARAALKGVLAALEAAPDPGEAGRRLVEYQRRLRADFAEKVRVLRRGVEAPALTAATLPASLRGRFVGESGRLLLRIYPRGDIWDRGATARFVDALRRVDTDVTGPPVHTFEASQALTRGYGQAGGYALLAIFVLSTLLFRHAGYALLGMVPLLAGAGWTLGVMAVVGLDFNLANLFALPLILAMGVDNGINLVARFREEEGRRFVLGTAVGKSMILASLTTIAGFGVLILAQHRGIASLGLLLALGVTNILLASLTLLPALLQLLRRATS
ncbi:MAG TPA: MMPL family transporter [Candidatus Methylomirabilis sp.]|nr:MMPL family transporter [Candidatus Methylomirabilis sp.]